MRAPTPAFRLLRRQFNTSPIFHHENPLGLPSHGIPKSGTIPRMARGLPTKQHIPSVTKIIAVSSAKGGVGKSTVSVNLALALAHAGKRTGILDTDIFGPSIPRLMNLGGEQPRLSEKGKLVPLVNYGVKTMSMGYLVDEGKAVVWRGLMVMKALQQLLWDVEWGGLDVLVLDLPPGTGDTQLTVTQQVVLDGAVVVSTPQDIALIDAVKGINMFRTVEVPILGMVQNMSMFTCPNCHHSTHIFGADGVARECEKHGIHLLGDVPLNATICQDADQGKPTVVARKGPLADAYHGIATKVIAQLWPEEKE
ncbi:P-loop containing nucleoside triphosphate hydrolase protein [Ascodesmis nigricans]|uniref:P-loop containing nucleoside triphosphate hydrolase protein n=1 Tax=Ascodesmis nigricans TaxID=341454 RepID=A0A4S2N6K5_9PEZI|nr:P-loop containing nucleoside triphosphate hydrolase protein [Ascodesmis nigricans]